MTPGILHEDDWLLVVDKPSGIAVHAGWARDPWYLVDWVRRHSGQPQVFPVNRLDRGTSGVVLFARTAEMARLAQEALTGSEASKRYIALVRGQPPEEGTVDHPIPRQEKGPRVEAITHFSLLQTAPTQPRHLSLVEAFPVTGRLHQVRRHLKHINHPIIGDANYGRTELNREIRERYGLDRLALHAQALTIRHPATGKLLSVAAPLPEDLTQPLERMGFSGLS